MSTNTINMMPAGGLLLHSKTFFHLRQDFRHESRIFKNKHSFRSVGGSNKFEKLLFDSFSGNFINERCIFLDCLKSIFFNSKAKLCCNPHSPHHSKCIFTKPRLGIANCSDKFFFNIYLPFICIN